MFYLVIDTDGDILVSTDSLEAANGNMETGTSLITLEEPVDVSNKRYVNGALEDIPIPDEILAEQAREERDTLLDRADGASIKQREQVDLGITPDLTDAQYTSLLQYKQDLRDVPTQVGFPQVIVWPTCCLLYTSPSPRDS